MFYAKVPEAQGLSDTLELYVNGYPSVLGPIYSTNQYEFFQIFDLFMPTEYILKFVAKSGGGAGVYVDDINVFEFTSVQDFSNSDLFIISPNPATSFVTLTTPQGEPTLEAVIYNHLGQKVLTAKPVNNTVDVSGLKAGMYLIEISTKDRKERTTFVKN
jgi:hypothetical protein